MLLCSDGVLHSEHSSARQISMIKEKCLLQIKKLRSLRSLRHSLVFIANKTPLAPSKCVSLLLKTPLASLAPSKLFCVAFFPPACSCLSQWWHERLQLFAATSALLAESVTLHFLLHVHGSCLLHMQHAMTTHTTLTQGGFLISKYTCCLGSTLVSLFLWAEQI